VAGLYSVKELLGELKASQAGTKILILDAGRMDYDPRLGIVENDFPSLLEKVVRDTHDTNLWVLCSHSDGQRSHTLPALHASVFGAYVASGLRGGADSNYDRAVNLDELHKFVAAKVAAWVEEHTDQQAVQIPRLLRGGNEQLQENEQLQNTAKAAHLVTVASLSADDRNVDVPQWVAGKLSRRPADVARHNAPAAVNRGLLVRVASPQPGDAQRPATGRTTGGPQTATSPAPGETADGPIVAKQDGNSSSTTGNGQGKAKEGNSADNSAKLFALLADSWRLRDKLAWSGGDSQATLNRPVDTTPHLWREMQEELVAYEQALRSNPSLADTSLLASLEAALAAFSPKDASPPLRRDLLAAGATVNEPVSEKLVRVEELRSLALARFIQDIGGVTPNAEKLPELVGHLNTVIAAPPEQMKPAIDALGWNSQFDRYFELRLFKRPTELPNLNPSLLQLALRARQYGESVAAIEIPPAWVDDQITLADRLRLAGERHIFDQIGLDWEQRARESLTQSIEGYSAVERNCQQVRQAIALRNELLFRVPYYVRLGGRRLRTRLRFADWLARQSYRIDANARQSVRQGVACRASDG
jgi:hypothetical protein